MEGSAPPLDESRLAEPPRTKRRKSNQLEKESHTPRQPLNRFSEINPEESARPREAKRQKRILQLRENPPLEEAFSQA